MYSRGRETQCFICSSIAHRTENCPISNTSRERDSPDQCEKFGLASNVDFRLRNDMDLGPLEDEYGKEKVASMARRLERSRSPSPTPDLPPAQVPDTPPRKRRVTPLKRDFRISKRRLSFPPGAYVSYAAYLALDNQYTILRHKYNRILALYSEAQERIEELSRRE